MRERYQSTSNKSPSVWCILFLLFSVSCTNPVREKPIYLKFGRQDVWQSWLTASTHVYFNDSPTPFFPGYSVPEEECLYEDIRGGIVSHHLLIAPVLMAYYRELVKVKPHITTFFIAGPDHFRRSKAHIAIGTRPYIWGTKTVHINKKVSLQMIKGLAIREDPIPFGNEHSILCHIPFIAAFYPGSTIVPVIIDNDCPLSLCRQVSGYIRNYMKKDHECFFLLSMDFSHHLSPGETKKRDAVSYNKLKKMNPSFPRDITCDSPKSWYIFTNTFSKAAGCMDIIYYTTNAAYLGKPVNDITSYFFTLLKTRK